MLLKWLFIFGVAFIQAFLFLSYLVDYDQFLMELVKNFIGR